MANELYATTTTDLTVYAVLLNATGQVWNGSAFVAIDDGDWTDYDIALTESAAGIYLGDMPAADAGAYSYVAYSQAGVNPATTDRTIGTGHIEWDGTAELALTTATIAAAVWAYTTRTLTSLSALLASIAAAVWAYATRTLTTSTVSGTTTVVGSTITILRGDTATIDITGLGDISARTKLWFTVKKNLSDEDSAAIIQITDADGLLYLRNLEVTDEWGSITVTDEVTGALTIVLAANATKLLDPRIDLLYDIQMLTATGVTTLTSGLLNVTADVTKVIA